MAMLSSTVSGRNSRRWVRFAMTLLAGSVFLLSLQTRLALYTPQASHSPIGSMKFALGESTLVLVSHKGELKSATDSHSFETGLRCAVSSVDVRHSSEVECAKLKEKYHVTIVECYSILSRPPPAHPSNPYPSRVRLTLPA